MNTPNLTPRPQPLAYSIAGAAEATGYSERVINDLCARGDLTRRYANRKPVILATDIEAWLNSLPYEPPH
ncbi:hypothetical protein ASE16_03625 [Leifsonia sp. Root227]|uniref:hypothetical protein n=1 Tax=Leifsonia sp. Root227 TaxID=1736496 RepID=UPI0006F48006|nr:hypothetical protein [Leifsonia sp. Root227]KRC52149.1 hypothetical protein ASE16_03625 [Leifsonia sp. Root227]